MQGKYFRPGGLLPSLRSAFQIFRLDRILAQNKDYFDNLLNDIDPEIKIDEEQRRAVATDDDNTNRLGKEGENRYKFLCNGEKYIKSNRICEK